MHASLRREEGGRAVCGVAVHELELQLRCEHLFLLLGNGSFHNIILRTVATIQERDQKDIFVFYSNIRQVSEVEWFLSIDHLRKAACAVSGSTPRP